jgi:hypothetical protein
MRFALSSGARAASIASRLTFRDDREAPLLSRRDGARDAADLRLRSTATDWHDGQISCSHENAVKEIFRHCQGPAGKYKRRHCLRQTRSVCAREQSDEAIQNHSTARAELLRFARNDGSGDTSSSRDVGWAEPTGRANARPMTGSACPPSTSIDIYPIMVGMAHVAPLPALQFRHAAAPQRRIDGAAAPTSTRLGPAARLCYRYDGDTGRN